MQTAVIKGRKREKSDEFLTIILQIKSKNSLIIRLKSIKYKKDIFYNLSFYSNSIFLTQYFIFLIEYQLIKDLSRQINYANNFNITTILSSH